MDEGFERFTREDTRRANEHMERCSLSSFVRAMRSEGAGRPLRLRADGRLEGGWPCRACGGAGTATGLARALREGAWHFPPKVNTPLARDACAHSGDTTAGSTQRLACERPHRRHPEPPLDAT